MRKIPWKKMTLRDRIAARLFVAFIYKKTEPITFIADVWATSTNKDDRKICRDIADSVIEEAKHG